MTPQNLDNQDNAIKMLDEVMGNQKLKIAQSKKKLGTIDYN